MKKIRIKFSRENVYTCLAILFPVFSIYASPIPGVELGTFLVLLFAFCCIRGRVIYKMPLFLSLFTIYSLLITIWTLINPSSVYYSEPISFFMRAMRFVLMMFIMVGYGYTNYFNSNKYICVLRQVTILAAGYAMAQTVTFWLLGIKLMNFFGPVKGGGYGPQFEEYDFIYRPPSFFAEPAHASYFMAPYLCYLLFHEKKVKRHDILWALFITLGIICTTSGQGLSVVALCWGIWGISQVKSLNWGRLLFLLFAICCIYYIMDIDFIISRIFKTEGLSAVDGRSVGYTTIKELPLACLFLGTGFGNYDDKLYYSSIAEIVFCTGVVGAFLVGIMYLSFFAKGVKFQKVLVLISCMLMAGGGIFSASYLCLYLPLLISNDWYSVDSNMKK